MSSLVQPSRHAGHDELVSWLISRWPESHPQPSLERISALCDLLGEPQKACPVIQITGTNGKGSTAIMIDALLRSMGLRTGRFSSPHLVDVTERICVDGEPISAERFDEIWWQIAPMVQMVDDQLLGGVAMSFFEVVTAMAYAAFADAPVDIAIVEVGMGGRWDATSVADARVAVVAPISLDHTHLLGNTIAEIASEKAGIIKPGSVAVLAGQTPEAAHVLMTRCVEVGAPMVREGVDFALLDRQPAVGGQLLRIDATDGPMGDIFLPLHGAHMAHNAALAVAAVEALRGAGLSGGVISEGLGAVQAPARLEPIGSEPLVVLDTAHNPQGVAATLEGLREAFTAQPLIGVLAMMRDKAVGEVMELLADQLDAIVVTTMTDNSRALSVDEIKAAAEAAFGPSRVHSAASPAGAIDLARGLAEQGGDDAAVLVIGSVYLAGEVREILRQLDAELGL
ncbi:cyanophycin synthetase [Brooklawnia sp.]|uniref:bifunctional folylpolyglutamate synthase/dihydrofolate synthase n=1 Tax=Brooklawnia sp. TaxID=2699740 RepID=UPI00311FC745